MWLLNWWPLNKLTGKKRRKKKIARNMYSVEDLAVVLKQDYKRVHYAIGKLGIKPSYEFAGRKAYSESTLSKLSRYFKTAKPYKSRRPRQQKQEETSEQNYVTFPVS